ncbi:MAG: winged helix-turn-helix transcriptional regulator [Candidatus Eisenbacteria bacterium]|nr:winged helix-turn-helix transcriptional regulator [Candidatus Eisenbacteria bacterium]
MSHGRWELFRILGVDTRLRIIELLADGGPLGTAALAERLGVTPAAVSQHLTVLRGAGLVTRERRGYRVPYSLNPGGLDVCCGHLVEVCSCGCGHHREDEGRHEPRTTVAALKRRARELRAELEAVEERIGKLERVKEPERRRDGKETRDELL